MPVDLSPLSARSVVLSLLLGAHPARMSPAELARAGDHFGISRSTLRVALTRGVAAGDLQRVDGDYALGMRLVQRQLHQDEAVDDAETPWDGGWEMAVVVVSGRSGPARAALRDVLAGHRLAELREGVWTRPANLRRPRDYASSPVLETFSTRPDADPAELAHQLWDLPAWASLGRQLAEALDATSEPARRLAVAAGLVRHLATDPLLPAPLLPPDWPGATLRATYASYRRELQEMSAAATRP